MNPYKVKRAHLLLIFAAWQTRRPVDSSFRVRNMSVHWYPDIMTISKLYDCWIELVDQNEQFHLINY